MKDAQLALEGGRALAYTEIGAADWPCVFFFHGAPSSRLRVAYLEEQFLSQRIRVISPDRPGYGGSSAQPGRTMADWPEDVAALADAVGATRFIVAGHSSGGPYALASAAMLPGRVLASITLGGITDMAWDGAWRAYPDFEKELMRMPSEDAAIAWCTERFGSDGAGFMFSSGFELPEADKPLYADESIASLLAVARKEAFRQGVTGYAQDVFVQGRPWPFDPTTIAGPVHILHGAGDTLLPIAHSRRTAEVIPRSTLRILPGHGHFTILGELPAVALGLVQEGA